MEWQNEIVNENMNMNYGPLNDLRLFRVHHNYHILMHFHIPSLTAIWRHCELDEYILVQVSDWDILEIEMIYSICSLLLTVGTTRIYLAMRVK